MAANTDAEILLTLTDVTAGYGAGLILKGVDLSVNRGESVCLIGPNGAGKSTVLKTISGLLRPKSGTVVFAGTDISAMTSRQRLGRGIVHVPQDRSLFPGMTVWENVMMGGFILSDPNLVRRRMEEVADAFPIVAKRRSSAAGSLSGGEQKQVELARSLMLDPALILLDEPSIGLDPKSRTSVFASIAGLAKTGRSVLLVEQNARSGLAVAHRAAVLEAGVVALTGSGESLLNDPEVARLYLGAGASAHAPRS
ncbi:MAG: branched-chain amino acid transport system ATP-binding protein [Microbacteriaceae bacterium]|nr:branched-chain amino acid transport system ATP-binding protein [Microbacteriaceae bacterium]